MALNTWNGEKSNRLIADQVGCSEKYVRVLKDQVRTTTHVKSDHVTGKDGKSYPSQKSDGKDAEIEALVRAGEESQAIRKKLHVSPTRIAQVRRDMGVGRPHGGAEDEVGTRLAGGAK